MQFFRFVGFPEDALRVLIPPAGRGKTSCFCYGLSKRRGGGLLKARLDSGGFCGQGPVRPGDKKAPAMRHQFALSGGWGCDGASVFTGVQIVSKDLTYGF